MDARIEMLAKQAGFWEPMGLPSDWEDGDYVVSPQELQRFAELVRNEVLEEAAKACDGWLYADGNTCADAIRSMKK